MNACLLCLRIPVHSIVLSVASVHRYCQTTTFIKTTVGFCHHNHVLRTSDSSGIILVYFTYKYFTYFIFLYRCVNISIYQHISPFLLSQRCRQTPVFFFDMNAICRHLAVTNLLAENKMAFYKAASKCITRAPVTLAAVDTVELHHHMLMMDPELLLPSRPYCPYCSGNTTVPVIKIMESS